MPPSGPRQTVSSLGIAYMAGAMFLFAAVDAQAKFLTDTFHPIQITWSRQLGLLIGVFVLMALRGVAVLRTQLADAVAVAFVAPFVVTLLSVVVLREPVGVRRWTAVTIGFVGAMIVIRPGLGVIHPAVLLVLLAATMFALRQILSRMLSSSDRTATTVAYTALVGSLLLTAPLPFVWQWPTTTIEVALLVDMAVLAALAEVLVIKALEVAQAVVVAPVMYTLLIWSTMYGYLVFAQLPDLWTWVGALTIVATGVYTLHRERVVARGV